MSTLNIKNLPNEIHESLKGRAEKNHRSLNREVAAILEQAVVEGPMPIGRTLPSQPPPMKPGRPTRLRRARPGATSPDWMPNGPGRPPDPRTPLRG